MWRLLAYASMLDRPFIQHCEDPSLTENGEMNEGETSTRLGLIGMPSEAEVIILTVTCTWSGEAERGIMWHIFQPGPPLNLCGAPKQKVLPLPPIPHRLYFLLNELAVSTYDTAFKLSPPLRSGNDRQAVDLGLADGTMMRSLLITCQLTVTPKPSHLARLPPAHLASTPCWHSP